LGETRWATDYPGATLPEWEHRLNITEFAIRLAEACRSYPRSGLQWSHNQLPSTQADNSEFRPTGLGVITLRGRSLNFLLEWPQGTEIPKDLGTRLVEYAGLQASPAGWVLQSQSPVVLLVVTTTPHGVNQVLEETALLMKTRKISPGRFILFATTTALIDEEGIFGPVWSYANVNSDLPTEPHRKISLPRLMKVSSPDCGTPQTT
jgi:hypothetical protein